MVANIVFRGRLWFVFCLLVALMLPASPARAQSSATLFVSPVRGFAGDKVTVSGTGFVPGGYQAIIFWDDKPQQGRFDIPQGGSFSISFVVPIDAAPGGHTITVCAADEIGCTAQLASTRFTVELGISDMPADMQRRLAQFLAEMRGGPIAPAWSAPRPSGYVLPMYRPDVEGIAYYEVEIINQTRGTNSRAFIPLVTGFVILSNGEHDFPIAHWSDNGLAPSRVLENQTTSAISRVYKLDSLAYAGEDAQGNRVATLGQQPAKLSGLDAAWLDRTDGLAANQLVLNQPVPDDNATGVISGTINRTGATPPAGLKIENWDSWAAMKSGFTTSYGVFLEDVRRQAALDWEIETNAARDGEALRKGDIYDLALLTDTGLMGSLGTAPTVTITGAGKNLVTGELIAASGQAPTFRITVIDALASTTVPFDVTIDYGGGVTETVKFLVIRTGHHVTLPLIVGGSSPTAQLAARQQTPAASVSRRATVQSDWGPWNYFWAGNATDQRYYSQMNAGSSPNTSGCYSGCGATAWAMLFGWADNQAALNRAPWTPRKGLYRENGGTGADVAAPATMDAGVRNMTWEIRNRIGTFCAFGSGATFPWNMGNAAGYLAGRSGTGLRTDYNTFGIHTDGLRERARDSIIRGTPAIIGTGWLSHYPLAYGYAWRSREVRRCVGPDLGFNCWTSTDYSRWFYVNQGWGGSGNGWVSAGTWFAGQILP